MKLYIVIALILILTGCKSAQVNQSVDTPLGDLKVNQSIWSNGGVGVFELGGIKIVN